MKIFDLKCENEHFFEGWFDNNEDYETQKENGLINCPVCNSSIVFKILSSFAIKSSQSNKLDIKDANDVKELAKAIYDFVSKNFENVGADFAKEALKIHYGVCEPRNIRGSSTQEEEKVLEQEGINFFKIPEIKQNQSIEQNKQNNEIKNN